MSEWQPIETAPRDGTPIRIYDPSKPWTKNTEVLARFRTPNWCVGVGKHRLTYHPSHFMPSEPPKEE